MVLGKKDVPIEYAHRSEEEDQEAKPEPEDQGPVPAGVPEFWLGAMRAHPLISEHVRLLPGTVFPGTAFSLLVAPSLCEPVGPMLRSAAEQMD